MGNFILGSFCLIICSFLQKSISGYDLWNVQSYFIPFAYGGMVGITFGYFYLKIRSLNMKLENKVLSFEKILPICSSCKKIRDDQGKWQIVQECFNTRDFSQGICPECMENLYPEFKNETP